MAGVALLARELGRPGTAAAALGWAVTVLLLLDPAWIDDAGFRLSVLATAGILAWGSSITERLAGSQPGGSGAGSPRSSASRSRRRRRRRRSCSSTSGGCRSSRRRSTSSWCRWSRRRWRRAPLRCRGMLVGARAAGDRRHARRPAGVGALRGDGRGRPARRRPAAREPRARATVGRVSAAASLAADPRRRRAGAAASLAEPSRGAAVAAPASGPSGVGRPQTAPGRRALDARRARVAALALGGADRRAGARRRPPARRRRARHRPRRRAGRRRSCSRAGAAAGWSSTAGRIPGGS